MESADANVKVRGPIKPAKFDQLDPVMFYSDPLLENVSKETFDITHSHKNQQETSLFQFQN